VETTAVKKNQEYILNGTKYLSPTGGVCDLGLKFSLFTNTDQTRLQSRCFYCRERVSRFFTRRVGRSFAVCAPIPYLPRVFRRLPCAGKKSLGKLGGWNEIGMAPLDNGQDRAVAAQALGIAQGAFEAAVKYAKERQQFKKAPLPRCKQFKITLPIWHGNSRRASAFIPRLFLEG